MSDILIVEDDVLLSDMIKRLLFQNHYKAVSAYSGSEALLVLEKQQFDLILLDLMLPGFSGETVLGEIRKKADIPVIGVSAKTDVDSRVNFIKNGADDYIVKPFDNAELLVRIEAVLRRYQKHRFCDTVLCFKDLTLNTDTLEVKIRDIPISLTKYEYLILQLLMTAPNKVFTKNNIFESVWEEEFFGDDNAINVHISNLRKKFAKANPQEQYIQTVWGLGFKMQE
ncbi:MAG: response regulator transcription factor [Eubacterium sp.]|nr:response regulator transcription factor [Eubacterium sp.]